MDLSVQLGPITLRNPILVASGTFGYAREMADLVKFEQLGGIIPKTVTAMARAGNPPPRTVETASGLLNAIGLDNDGIDHFLHTHWPYLATLPAPVIGNVAGKSASDFVELARKMGQAHGMAAIELNLSCPNVSGGTDFATDPVVTKTIIRQCRDVCPLPLIAKLTPNITDVRPIIEAAAEGGAVAVSLVNTFMGMAVDWRRRKPILGNVTGGLSGPAIKPLVLRIVHQAAQQNILPIIAVGGISTLDDVMEFLVTGATAVQIGTANFYDPTGSNRIVEGLPAAVASLQATRLRDIIRTLNLPNR